MAWHVFDTIEILLTNVSDRGKITSNIVPIFSADPTSTVGCGAARVDNPRSGAYVR